MTNLFDTVSSWMNGEGQLPYNWTKLTLSLSIEGRYEGKDFSLVFVEYLEESGEKTYGMTLVCGESRFFLSYDTSEKIKTHYTGNFSTYPKGVRYGKIHLGNPLNPLFIFKAKQR